MVTAHRIFDLSYSMWDLVPWPRIKLRPPILGAQSLSHWTTWEVPEKKFFNSRKFQEVNMNSLHIGHYLHSIYMVLGIISDLEII